MVRQDRTGVRELALARDSSRHETVPGLHPKRGTVLYRPSSSDQTGVIAVRKDQESQTPTRH